MLDMLNFDDTETIREVIHPLLSTIEQLAQAKSRTSNQRKIKTAKQELK